MDIGTEVAFIANLDMWGVPSTHLLGASYLKTPWYHRGRIISFIPGTRKIEELHKADQRNTPEAAAARRAITDGLPHIRVMDRKRHVWKIKVYGDKGY